MSYIIGVLTMVDLCKDTIRKPEDPYWELKERLDGIRLISIWHTLLIVS